MSVNFRTISFDGTRVEMIDQTTLPREENYLVYDTPEGVAEGIRTMVVRGAPAIGIAAGYGMALAAVRWEDASGLDEEIRRVGDLMGATRPTAVNLFWAIERMLRVLEKTAGQTLEERRQALCDEARAIHEEDAEMCQKIGEHGADLLGSSATVMTHCNAGALATGGCGTALGVIRVAIQKGKEIRVLSNETRPFLQGARLTVWELMKDGIDVTLLADNAAGSMIRRGQVDAIVVGTDRTVANGDVANKIGTYSLAVLAHENGIPFYVAAPTSTIDLSIGTGDEIEIEERDASEVTGVFGTPVAPEGARARNPAFDVTPARYVTAIITERGVARAPYEESLARIMQGS